MNDTQYVPNPRIDPDTLTVGEFTAFEELTGYGIADTIKALTTGEWATSATVLTACLLIAGNRDRPNAWSLDDVARIPFGALIALRFDDDEEPTPEG